MRASLRAVELATRPGAHLCRRCRSVSRTSTRRSRHLTRLTKRWQSCGTRLAAFIAPAAARSYCSIPTAGGRGHRSSAGSCAKPACRNVLLLVPHRRFERSVEAESAVGTIAPWHPGDLASAEISCPPVELEKSYNMTPEGAVGFGWPTQDLQPSGPAACPGAVQGANAELSNARPASLSS